MAAKKTVSTVEALSTRTLSWWAFKRLAPGTAFTLFCVYGVPALVDALRAGGAA
ncbi:MAG: hypothetical protein PGN11_05835 [Quadrisphaera sp.]